MPSRRIKKVNQTLLSELATIINKEIEGQFSSFITLTEVETSPDLRYAKVWISIFGGNERKVFAELNKLRPNIQKLLNARMKMKYVPKISFYLDKSQEKIARIEKLLRKDKGLDTKE